MERLTSFLMSLALAAAAAGLAYLATTERPASGEIASGEIALAVGSTANPVSRLDDPNVAEEARLREAWFCADGCEFNISREFPCACPTADDEVTP